MICIWSYAPRYLNQRESPYVDIGCLQSFAASSGLADFSTSAADCLVRYRRSTRSGCFFGATVPVVLVVATRNSCMAMLSSLAPRRNSYWVGRHTSAPARSSNTATPAATPITTFVRFFKVYSVSRLGARPLDGRPTSSSPDAVSPFAGLVPMPQVALNAKVSVGDQAFLRRRNSASAPRPSTASVPGSGTARTCIVSTLPPSNRTIGFGTFGVLNVVSRTQRVGVPSTN